MGGRLLVLETSLGCAAEDVADRDTAVRGGENSLSDCEVGWGRESARRPTDKENDTSTVKDLPVAVPTPPPLYVVANVVAEASTPATTASTVPLTVSRASCERNTSANEGAWSGMVQVPSGQSIVTVVTSPESVPSDDQGPPAEADCPAQVICSTRRSQQVLSRKATMGRVYSRRTAQRSSWHTSIGQRPGWAWPSSCPP